MNKPIGIDLGTTNSAVAEVTETGRPAIVKNRAGKTTTPSCVLFRENGEIVVGEQAKHAALVKVDDVAQFVKRRMCEPDWVFEDGRGEHHSVEEISALILKKLKQDSEASLGCEVADVVITVPAYFGDLERNRTKMAGELAGFNVLRLINEPTAAAITYGIDKIGSDSLALVYDLGGGTFDVTVLAVHGTNIEVVATDGHRYLGGVDFDADLCAHFAEVFENEHGINPTDDTVVYQDFFSRAEAAKIALSEDTVAYVALSAAGKTTQIELQRTEFEDLIRPRLDITVDLMNDVLEAAGQKLNRSLSWTDIDAVLLVGGSTRIPLVQETVRNLTNISTEIGVNPDEIVAVGASIVAAQTAGHQILDKNLDPLPQVAFKDVTAHALGVLTYDPDKDEHYNTVVVPRNTPIPFEISDMFTTVKDNQTSMNCVILEGEDRDPKHCTELGKGVLKGIPPMPRGKPSVEDTFRFDEEGIVHFSARELTTGSTVEVVLEIPGLLSRSERQEVAKKIDSSDLK